LFDSPSIYVEVILPLAVANLYTYSVPEEFVSRVGEGKRVMVQFGKQKIYAAVVRRILHEPPHGYTPKPIIQVLDENRVVNDYQFKLWEWIAFYYLCTTGEVMQASLPSVFKMQSETKIIFNPSFDRNYESLTDREYLVAEALEIKGVLSLQDISAILDLRTIMPLVKSMIDRGIILLEEEAKDKYREKKEVIVRLTTQAMDEDFTGRFLNQAEKKSPRQYDLLMHFLKIKSDQKERPVTRLMLLKAADSTPAILNQLIKKNILMLEEVSPLQGPEIRIFETIVLNEDQQQVKNEILTQFENKPVVLLHGITSSGKTEIYMSLIESLVKQGKQALYLLPEIALTTQMIGRLKKHFGNHLLVYHSKFNENERASVWNRVLSFSEKKDIEKYQVIIGARSAALLPFSDLGLVIVDEEHETSYKQFDPAPRYHARDSALVLAMHHGAKTILGSATPAVESYYNAKTGKYGLVSLLKRYADVPLPILEIADMKEETRKKIARSNFSTLLVKQMEEALSLKEQVILFQNRRGFAVMVQCNNCHWIPHCIYCDVTLTYHKKDNRLKCHYCGYSTDQPVKCVACGSPDLRLRGIGTERVEDDLAMLFPDKKIARLDLDSVRSKNALQHLIADFERRDTDILVGTQMVTKGFHFDHVSTVAIINADGLIHYPGFRSSERSYQLMVQVSGRAGRKNKQGRVVIQAYNPANPVIQFVLKNDYEGFYHSELEERRKFGYPPFYRIIEFTLKHRDEKKLEAIAVNLHKDLKSEFGNRVMGPVQPVISRIKNLHIRMVLLKIEKKAPLQASYKLIHKALDFFKQEQLNRSAILHMDVDPY
jgi:primosomal protein N' (replication factor Y) (superfamily II helicase)